MRAIMRTFIVVSLAELCLADRKRKYNLDDWKQEMYELENYLMSDSFHKEVMQVLPSEQQSNYW